MSAKATPKGEKSNLQIWSLVEKTNPQYTRPFARPRGHRGTAINAEYLAKRATEVFGPLGLGWGVDILDEQIMQGAPIFLDGTVIGHELIHKVRVRLWYKWDGQTGEVHQFGETTFVGRDRNGLYTDEDAPKKSLTDAMVKCLSLLGFSADVYMGLYDDNKYVTDLRREFEQEEGESAKEPKKAKGKDREPVVEQRSGHSAVTEELTQQAIANYIGAIRGAPSMEELDRVEQEAVLFAQSCKNHFLEQSLRRDASARRKQLGERRETP